MEGNKVGADEFGYMLANILKENNVDNFGMCLHTCKDCIDLIKKACIFHYRSISLIEEHCRSALAAMDIAKKAGCIFSYDPNLRLPLWPSAEAAQKLIMSIWNQADIIKISEDEITFLTGGEDPYDDDVVLNKLYHPNLKLLLVTEGQAGGRYYTKVNIDFYSYQH